MRPRLLYLGGNGHCAARLEPAREALARQSSKGIHPAFDLVDIPYPGFDDRPRAGSFDTLLANMAASITDNNTPDGRILLYGTGIGGLLALCLRARGMFHDLPLLLQAPVLWGLEHRLMPRVMRLGPMRFLLRWLFARSWFQQHFIRKQFTRPVSPALQRAFFAGYARCPAAADFFAWLTPALLRQLEQQIAGQPEALRAIGVWWGGHDRVVRLQELTWTEQALGVSWLVRIFPQWGHYPMIDEPDEWVRAISDVLAAPEAVPGPVHSEAR